MAKILLVDDEPDFLVVMEKMLSRKGHSVSEAVNAQGAFQKIREAKPDMVLLDVMMGDINGWEVCKKIKEDPDTKDLPILMLTVMSEEENKTRSFEYAGADWHIPKPFDTDTLFLILEMSSRDPLKKTSEAKIKKALEKEERLQDVLDMINPKLLNHKYEFLQK